MSVVVRGKATLFAAWPPPVRSKQGESWAVFGSSSSAGLGDMPQSWVHRLRPGPPDRRAGMKKEGLRAAVAEGHEQVRDMEKCLGAWRGHGEAEGHGQVRDWGTVGYSRRWATQMHKYTNSSRM